MAPLRDQVVADTLSVVRIVYLDRETAKWWNAKRGEGEPMAFTGWYWVVGRQEAGPFKTRSAAIRDAYYARCLRSALPKVGHEASMRVARTEPRPRKGKHAGGGART